MTGKLKCPLKVDNCCVVFINKKLIDWYQISLNKTENDVCSERKMLLVYLIPSMTLCQFLKLQ